MYLHYNFPDRFLVGPCTVVWQWLMPQDAIVSTNIVVAKILGQRLDRQSCS